jgi:hypothetical protein
MLDRETYWQFYIPGRDVVKFAKFDWRFGED